VGGGNKGILNFLEGGKDTNMGAAAYACRKVYRKITGDVCLIFCGKKQFLRGRATDPTAPRDCNCVPHFLGEREFLGVDKETNMGQLHTHNCT